MKYGMTDVQFQMLDSLVIQPLKDCGAEVFIFGSRVTGKNHPHSDVDLVFRNYRTSIAGSRLSQIKEAIEESKFPFSVDLVNEEDFPQSYRKSVLGSMQAL